MSESPFLSVVIPALDEADRIAGLVGKIRREEGVEVIVADGGSTDGTAELARSCGAVVVGSDRGRALQMNAGGRRAGGEAILFLHADTRLPEGFPSLVRRALGADDVAGGAFRFGLDGNTPLLRCVATLANFRARRLGIIFGDQGIFVRAKLFRTIGGFPGQPVMEDYEFVRRLRRYGKVVTVPATAVTSARRWLAVGPVKNSGLNVIITWAYILGVSPQRLKIWHRKGTGEGRSESRGGLN